MKRLLVADDDAGMRAALEARFQRRGWLVDVAVNGTEALQKFRAGLHSLVITDVRMPGRDGFELMREMQTLDAHSPSARTAVILLTAYGCVPDAVEAMRNGACDYGKIGDWIEKLGFATEQEVTTALALQWGCPVASSFDPAAIQFQSSIPLPILESFCMLPFNYAASTNTLYIAFGERVDHGALYAIERILDCRTQPCVTGHKIVASKLEAMRQLPHRDGQDRCQLHYPADSRTSPPQPHRPLHLAPLGPPSRCARRFSFQLTIRRKCEPNF